MGAVRAAAAVAAPEVALAGAAGRRGARSPVPDPRKAAPGSTAAKQRQQIEDVKASRPAPPPTSSGDGADPADSTPPAPTSPAPAGRSLPSITVSPAAQTGSGFLLGLFLWGWVGLPYLRGGAPEVRRTLAAKFLNKTGG